MTSPAALTQPNPAPTLESRRDAWHTEQRTHDDKGRTQALDLYRAHPPFFALYPQASLRDFLTWWGYGKYNGKFYTWFHAGCALDKNFTDPRLTRGDLAVIGQALWEDGHPEKDVRAAYDQGGINAVRLMRGKKAVTTVQVPVSLGEAVRDVISAVSQYDNIPAPEAAARIVQAFGGADPVIQAALLHSHATGGNALDALVRAVDERRDYRSALKAQGCTVCGVTVGIELHHVKTASDDRYRTHNRLVPLCQRHHGARPGDAADSIHARPFADLAEDADFWRRAFIAVSDAAESVRPLDSQPAPDGRGIPEHEDETAQEE